MAKTIAVANQKGGVGKTSTASALAAGLAQRGHRVLAVDLDPQASLTDSIGAQRSPGVSEVLRGEASALEAIQQHGAFDIMAAGRGLALAERGLEGSLALKAALEPLLGGYEYIVLDTPPSLGLLSVSALAAADEAVVPATPGILEIAGIASFCEAVAEVRRLVNPGLKIAGVLFTRFSARTRLSREALEAAEAVGAQLGFKVYKAKIRSSVDIGGAQASSESIYAYKKRSKAAQDYSDWVDEYLRGGE